MLLCRHIISKVLQKLDKLALMIAAQTVVESGIDIPSSTVLHPKVQVCKGESGNVMIGASNIIEELSFISGSSLGDGNLIEVGSVIKNVSIHQDGTILSNLVAVLHRKWLYNRNQV